MSYTKVNASAVIEQCDKYLAAQASKEQRALDYEISRYMKGRKWLQWISFGLLGKPLTHAQAVEQAVNNPDGDYNDSRNFGSYWVDTVKILRNLAMASADSTVSVSADDIWIMTWAPKHNQDTQMRPRDLDTAEMKAPISTEFIPTGSL